MKNDYLWSKTGTDAEIERLESLLSDFRYTPSAAPEPVRAAARGWWWTLVPVAVATVIGIVIWTGGTRNSLQPVGDEVAQVIPVVERMPVATTATDEPLGPSRPTITNAMYAVRRSPKAKARKSRPVDLPVTLTAEEKHAYEQVLLALYVSGSQLKKAQDKIDVIENRKDR